MGPKLLPMVGSFGRTTTDRGQVCPLRALPVRGRAWPELRPPSDSLAVSGRRFAVFVRNANCAGDSERDRSGPKLQAAPGRLGREEGYLTPTTVS